MHKYTLTLCLSLLSVLLVDGKWRNGRGSAVLSNHFDVLIFTQRWPQTVCFLWKENSESHECSLPKDDEWTIHGIWPSVYHKLGPMFCNKSMPFNPTALKPLETELREKWIDVENGPNPYSFWRHEWEKHGTCAAVLDQFNTEVKYFQEGLSLLNTYDMKNVLAKANIMPGNQYAVKDMFKAVQKVLGKTGEIVCAKSKETGESYIFEIRICFDKSLQLIDCDGVYEFPTNCDESKPITYPGVVPHNYQVLQI